MIQKSLLYLSLILMLALSLQTDFFFLLFSILYNSLLRAGHYMWVIGTEVNKPLVLSLKVYFIWLGVLLLLCLLFAVAVGDNASIFLVSLFLFPQFSLCFLRNFFLNRV